MTRDEEIDSLFLDTLGVFNGLLVPLRLSEEESEQLDERAFQWFDRFVRRPGQEQVPVGYFLIPLLSAVRSLAHQVAASKGMELASIAARPFEIGVQLGLIKEAERSER